MSYRVDRFAQEDTSDLQSLSGVPGGSTNLGTFTGNTIPDNQTTKQALQALETEVDDRLPDFVQWRVGTGPGYYFDGSDEVSPTLSLQGWEQTTFVFDFLVTGTSGTRALIGDYASTASYSLSIFLVNSTNILQIVFTDGTNTNRTTHTTTWSAAVGQLYNCIVVRSASNAAIVYINGEQVYSGSGVVTGTGATAFSLATTPKIGANRIGTDRFIGNISRVQILNRSVTGPEAQLLSRGQSLGFADEGADGSALYSQNTSAGVDSWVAVEGSVSGNIDAIGGVDDTLRFTINNANVPHYIQRTISATQGKRYRITGRFFIPSSNSDLNGVNFAGISDSLFAQFSAPALDSWVSVYSEFVKDNSNNYLRIVPYKNGGTTFSDAGGDDVIYFKDIKITPIGEVLRHTGNGAAPGVWANEANNSIGNSTVTGATLINRRALSVDKFASFTNLPTSSAGLAVGRMWLDGNTPKIVT